MALSWRTGPLSKMRLDRLAAFQFEVVPDAVEVGSRTVLGEIEAEGIAPAVAAHQAVPEC